MSEATQNTSNEKVQESSEFESLSKTKLNSENLEENADLKNRLSANSKAESIDDSHEFVEANSSFPDDAVEHNEDDKLAFKG